MNPTLWKRIEDIVRLHPILSDHLQTLRVYMELLERHDSKTCEHCLRVGDIAYRAGIAIGLNPAALFYAGILHDFGKIAVPRAILRRHRANFSEEDFIRVQSHVLYGYRLLRTLYPFSSEILLRHHRFQKNPYPLIPLEPDFRYGELEMRIVERCARILALVDFYDAFITRGRRCEKVAEALLREYPEQKEIIECLFSSGVFENMPLPHSRTRATKNRVSAHRKKEKEKRNGIQSSHDVRGKLC